MENPNQIDELLRQRLQDAVAPPPAFVWPRVEAALRKRRRRGLFFWLFASGIAGAGLLGWWQHEQQQQEDLVQQQDIQAALHAEQRITEVSPSPHAIQHVRAESPVSGTALSAPANKKQKKARGARHEKEGSIPPPQATFPTGSNAYSTVEIPPTQQPSASQYTRAIPTTDIPVQHVFITPQLPTLESRLTGLTPHFLPLTAAKKIIRNKKETRNCYDFAEHPNVLLLDAYLGPSLTRKEMRTGPDNQPYLAQRRNTETKDWSFSAGLRASLLLDRHFLLRSGIHYDQITEVFEYIDPNSVEVTIRQTTQIVNGQPVTVIDTLGVEYGEKYLKSFNRFGMLDIPLQAGVELRNGRTGLSLNGGIALNVLFWKRGAIISPVDGQPAYFTPGSGTVEVFRANAGLSAMGSVQWFCHLRPRLRVFAEPYVRMVLRPVNVPGHPVEQRYGILGLHIGVTRIFD